MASRVYNESSFQYAMGMLESDPFHAVNNFKEYATRYPKDYYARVFYALSLTRVCMFEEAEREYIDICAKASNDNHFNNKGRIIYNYKYNMLVVKMKILAFYEKYDELLNLVNENIDMFSPSDIKYVSYYCRMKMGTFDSKYLNSNSYRLMQSYNYSEELFREHIKKHLKEYNDNEIVPNDCIFESDFPIDKVIDEVKKYIPSDKKIFPGYFDNAYYFRYDNCGIANKEKTNIFTVICYHNTNNIITMCPVNNCDKLPYVDINYLKYEIDEPKVKRLSQIEKFNKRFNRN